MKPKTNKDRIRDCIIKQGVEHLACSYKKEEVTIWIHRVGRKDMKLLADAVLRLRAVKVSRVTVIHNREYFIFEPKKDTLRVTKV